MIKNGLEEAPFDAWGNLQHYAPPRSGYYTQVGTDWRPNTPMELVIRVDSVRSGRSAKYLIWVDTDGHTYPMFVSDLVEMLQEGATMERGIVHAMFRVRKRGQNFGLSYVGPVATAEEVAA